MRLIPTRASALALAALALLLALALLAGLPPLWAERGAAAAALLLAALAGADALLTHRAWRRAPLHWQRELPAALALGVSHAVSARLVNDSARAWRVTLFDHPDPSLAFEGLPRRLLVPARKSIELAYRVKPGQRGPVRFGRAELRVRTLFGVFERIERLGSEQALRVYPNFAAVANYAWLAGDSRLAEIGIRAAPQRGSGTDFKQLADYRSGDPIRHIDWKATLRQRRPIVREYQDERDQQVLFLLDCGRRMRADEGGGPSHFDEALNALMLLAHVALAEGDSVGALTFGNAPGQTRRHAPRKGLSSLNALIGALYDIQPQAVHSDYEAAAAELMRVQRKRCLVVVLTNFRDEDATELGPALRLMRSRHLVLLASLRERALRDIAEQPLTNEASAIEVAGAHLFAQSRRRAFAQLAAGDALMIDAEPARLPVELVNHYRAVKRSGAL